MTRKSFGKVVAALSKARGIAARRELRAIRSYSITPLPTLENLNLLAQDLLARNIAGDFVECGVCNGGSAAAIACELSGSGRHVWLYDSFEGLPAISEIDGKDAERFVGQCVGSEQHVRKAMQIAKVSPSEYTIRKGWFQETFHEQPLPRQIAILHVDADWYDSVMLTLQTFYDLVSDGGLIVLDDFGHWEGCREAFYDFVSQRNIKPLLERFGPTEAYWIKNRLHNREQTK